MLQKYFGLRENPFSIHPNPLFYCDLKCHDEALQLVLYSIKNYDTLIKVTGQIGLGKSMVAACVRNKLAESHHVCEIRNPNMETESLISSLINQLKVPRAKDKGLLPAEILESRLKYYSKQIKPVVLIVDEAQAMEDALLETLRLLTNLEQMGKPLLQIVLFGQKELDMKLYQDKFKQFKQRISFSYEIRALRRREVGIYMDYRLMVAGMEGRSIFQQDAIDLIARFTQGVPRNINIIAHKSMLFAQAGQSLDVRSHHVWKALYDHGLVSYMGLLKQWKLGFFLGLLVVNLGVLYGVVHLYYSSTGGLVESLAVV